MYIGHDLEEIESFLTVICTNEYVVMYVYVYIHDV